jgi:hypothetical protein
MTLMGSEAIRQSEVFLTWYPVTESCFMRENLRKDNQLLMPTSRRSRDSQKTHGPVPHLRCN